MIAYEIGDRILDNQSRPGTVIAKTGDDVIVYLDSGYQGWPLPSTFWDLIDSHTVQHVNLTSERFYQTRDRNTVTGLLHCVICNNPNPHAEPNLPNGKYKCFDCRT